MLFGKVLKQGAPFTFNEDILDNPEIAEAGAVLAIHNIALAPENLSQTSLWVKKDDQEFLIATLSKEHSHASIDLHLFIQDDSQLFVKGNGSTHVLGSFELDEEPFDSENLYGGEGDSDEEGEDEDEEDSQEEAAPKKAEVPKPQVLKHVGAGDKKSPAVNPQAVGSKFTPPVKASSPTGSPKLNANQKPQPVDNDSDNEDEDLDQEDSLIDDDQDLDDEDLDEIDDSIDDEDAAPPTKQAKLNPQQGQQGKKPFVPNQNKGGFQGGNQNKPNQNNNKPFNKGPGGQQHQGQNRGGQQGNNRGGFQGGNQNRGKPFKKN